MNNTAIDRELRRRCREQLSRTHLAVDYYRIRRRLVFPLPLVERPLFTARVASLENYPWEIWLLWELEERLGALGWAAQLFQDSQARETAERELAAVAAWPVFVPPDWHGLTIGHYLRLLCTARISWTWMSDALRKTIDTSLAAHVSAAEKWRPQIFLDVIHAGADAQVVAARPDAESWVHNIKVIALLGYAMAANVLKSPEAAGLNACAVVLIKLLFILRDRGVSEAVGYDGYTLDFIAFWMTTIPADQRDALLDDPHWDGFFHESLYLAAPGDVLAVAELSDVEPIQMPFHVTPQTRMQQWRPLPERSWYLHRCEVDKLRVDALPSLRELPEESPQAEPPAGALDALYARVLRTGWQKRDVAVAVAASTSGHGHIHDDYGTFCIGSNGRWILADPGYQQYRGSSERNFTLGAKAHNAPVINGQQMKHKAGRVVSSSQMQANLWQLALDLTACYPPEAGASHVMRTIWLLGKRAVVVADVVRGAAIATLEYNWHGHPLASWNVIPADAATGRNAAALVYLPPEKMWIASPQSTAFTNCDIQRLRGSRGHQTLSLTLQPAPVIWWVFSMGPAPHAFNVTADGLKMKILNRTIAPTIDPMAAPSVPPSPPAK